MERGEIIIYQTPDGGTNLEVRLEKDTVWLSLNQISSLFDRDKSVVSRHIRNIYKEQELEESSTVAKNATVQKENGREVIRQIDYYNLDVIISVGYRVKSQRGTQFRIWANKILKEYLVKGYVVNEKIKLQQYSDLKQTVKLLSNVLQSKDLSADEATGLLQVISDYTYALDTLDRYDYQELAVEYTTPNEPFRATYDSAMEVVDFLKKKFGGSDLFGHEKDDSFKSSINTIYQTFDGQDLYPSVAIINLSYNMQM